MRLQVADSPAGDARERIEGAELVEHIGGQLRRCHVDAASPETCQVAVTDLRSDRHATGDGPGADLAHDVRVASVKAAGNVGAGDHVEQCLVIAQAPPTEALSEVGIEVDEHPSTLRHRRPPMRRHRCAKVDS
jgi:hypothetical protein